MIFLDPEDSRIVILPCSGKVFVGPKVILDREAREMVPHLEFIFIVGEVDHNSKELQEGVEKLCELQLPIVEGAFAHFKEFATFLKKGEPELSEEAISVVTLGNGEVIIDFSEDYDVVWVNHFERALDELVPLIKKLESDRKK